MTNGPYGQRLITRTELEEYNPNSIVVYYQFGKPVKTVLRRVPHGRNFLFEEHPEQVFRVVEERTET